MTVIDLSHTEDAEFTQFLADRLSDNALWKQVLADQASTERARLALGQMNTSVEGAMATKRAEFARYEADNPPRHEYKQQVAEYADWKRRAAWFRGMVANRIKETRFALGKFADDRGATRTALNKIAAGVVRHRQALQEADLEPEEHDLALWAMLAEVEVHFSDRPMSIEEAFAQGRWTLNILQPKSSAETVG